MSPDRRPGPGGDREGGNGPSPRAWRLLGVAWIAALGLAFVLRPVSTAPDGYDPEVWGANESRWERLDEDQREELRRSWERFEQIPPARQEVLVQRADTLRRTRQRLAARPAEAVRDGSGAPVGSPTATGSGPAPDPAAVSDEEVLAEFGRLAGLVRARLETEASGQVERFGLARAVQQRARRSIEAFLGNMVRRGRMTSQELDALKQLSYRELARESLLRLKAERIALWSEGPGVGSRDVADLRVREAADAVDNLAQRRRQVGFLGRLGEQVPLTAEDQRALAAVPAMDVDEALVERKRDEVVALLQRLGQPPERIEQLLSLPLNELERELHGLLAPR